MCFHCSPFRWHPNFWSVIITQPRMFEFLCFISDLSLSQWITNTFWQHHRECCTMGNGSYGSWVKYSVGHMGRSWVTRSDPSPTLARRHWDVFIILAPDINIQTYLLTYRLTTYCLATYHERRVTWDGHSFTAVWHLPGNRNVCLLLWDLSSSVGCGDGVLNPIFELVGTQ